MLAPSEPTVCIASNSTTEAKVLNLKLKATP